MNEKNDFALVRRPLSAVEKAAPGAKRILSGMVADALALAKKEPLARIVVVNDNPGPMKTVELYIRYWLKNVTLLLFGNPAEAWQELSQTAPDLLITADAMPALRGEEIVRRLAERKVAYPIVVMSAWSPTELWVRNYASRGLNVSFLAMPFLLEDFRKTLEASLKISLGKSSIK